MAKESGLSVTLTIDDEAGTGRDVSNDVGSTNIDTPVELHESTGLDKSAHETIAGLSDFTATIDGYFNDTADTGLFDVLATASSNKATRTFSWALSGQTLAVESLISRTSFGRARNAEMTLSAEFKLQSGTDPTWS